MYAIRGTRPLQGFRVGEIVFHFAAWILVAAITAEHEHAVKHGALFMLEDVAGPEDVRLAPFPVTVEGEEKPTIRSHEELVAEFRAELARRDEELANLHTQLLAMEAENQQAYEEIAELRGRVGGVETHVGEVAAAFENFPAADGPLPVAGGAGPVEPSSVSSGEAGHNDLALRAGSPDHSGAGVEPNAALHAA